RAQREEDRDLGDLLGRHGEAGLAAAPRQAARGVAEQDADLVALAVVARGPADGAARDAVELGPVLHAEQLLAIDVLRRLAVLARLQGALRADAEDAAPLGIVFEDPFVGPRLLPPLPDAEGVRLRVLDEGRRRFVGRRAAASHEQERERAETAHAVTRR